MLQAKSGGSGRIDYPPKIHFNPKTGQLFCILLWRSGAVIGRENYLDILGFQQRENRRQISDRFPILPKDAIHIQNHCANGGVACHENPLLHTSRIAVAIRLAVISIVTHWLFLGWNQDLVHQAVFNRLGGVQVEVAIRIVLDDFRCLSGGV